MKNKKIIWGVLGILIGIAFTLIEQLLFRPSYSIETPFWLVNETDIELQISTYFIDNFKEGDSIYKIDKDTIATTTTKGLSHPDYKTNISTKFFLEVSKDDQIITTYSDVVPGKGSTYIIKDNPIRVEYAGHLSDYEKQ